MGDFGTASACIEGFHGASDENAAKCFLEIMKSFLATTSCCMYNVTEHKMCYYLNLI